MEDLDDRATTSALTPARLGLIARRRWWMVLLCLVLAAGGATAYVKERPASFNATAVVTVQPLPTAAGSAAGALPGPDPATEVETPAVLGVVNRATPGSVRLTATINATSTAINIKATAPSAAQASTGALAAARAFVVDRSALIRAEATALNTQISTLGTQINTLGATAKTNPFDAAKLAVVQGELQSYYTEQQNDLVAAQEVLLASDVPPVAQQAGATSKKVLELALLAGLLVGCAVALVADRLDDRLRSPAELVEIGDVALLAELPTRSSGGRSTFVTADSHDELSEAVRQLRTALRFLSVDKPLRTLLVTSASPGEGKSFVAANLAVALAVSGARTILVSSDLRRPRLESMLESAPSSRGLSEAIADAALTAYSATNTRNGAGPAPHAATVDLDRLLVMTGVENLLLVPAGAAPPNPAELLGSSHMGNLIEALKAESDIVILDSPPVLAVTDALVLTAHSDGVLLVMAKGRTSRTAARRALRLLESGLAPVLGVALNLSARPDAVPYAAHRKFGSNQTSPRKSWPWRRPEPVRTAARAATKHGSPQTQRTP